MWQLFGFDKNPLRVDRDLCNTLSCVLELECLTYWIVMEWISIKPTKIEYLNNYVQVLQFILFAMPFKSNLI